MTVDDGGVYHLKCAIAALYGEDLKQRQGADAYLKAARSRDGFWKTALQLLCSNSASTQEQFFAANALRLASLRARDLLQPEEGRGLAVALSHNLLHSAAAQNWVVARQLAGALAVLALRAEWCPTLALVPELLHLLGAPHHQPQQDPSPQQSTQSCRLQAALALLSVLPEACLSRDASLHPARRAAVTAALATSREVVPLATLALSQPAAGSACQLEALSLLQAWSALPGAAQALRELPGPLLLSLHQAMLESPRVATQAAEALAGLYGAAEGGGAVQLSEGGDGDPPALALLALLLPHLQETVRGALDAAQREAQQAQHAAQLLNAALTLLGAAAAALLANLRGFASLGGAKAEGGGGRTGRGSVAEGGSLPHQAGAHTAMPHHAPSPAGASVAGNLERQGQQQGGGLGQGYPPFPVSELWAALCFTVSCLETLLQHSDIDAALSSLEVLDACVLPGLSQLAGGGVAGTGTGAQQALRAELAQQAQQLLQRLCGALLKRLELPRAISEAQATADARDLPDACRAVRKEASETFRTAATTLGSTQAVHHVLQLAVESCTVWATNGAPSAGWQELECALYALNLVLPKHLAQQAQQGAPAHSAQAHQAAQQIVSVCLPTLCPSAPKLAGTALTLLGGMGEALLPLASGASPAVQQLTRVHYTGEGGCTTSPGDLPLLDCLLQSLLGLLCCSDAKLSRNAATAVHRLCCVPGLAAALVARYTQWVHRLAELYFQAGRSPRVLDQESQELSREEFMLRALCHLARAAGSLGQTGISSSAQGALVGGSPACGEAGALGALLLRGSASQAHAALLQVQQLMPEPSRWHAECAEPSQGLAAALRQCALQLDALSTVAELNLTSVGWAAGAGTSAGTGWATGGELHETWGVVQGYLQLLSSQLSATPRPSEQQVQHAGGDAMLCPPPLAPVLQAACRAAPALLGMLPRPSLLHSTLGLLCPFVSAHGLPHPCVLLALKGVVAAAAAAPDAATLRPVSAVESQRGSAAGGPAWRGGHSSTRAGWSVPSSSIHLTAPLHGPSHHHHHRAQPRQQHRHQQPHQGQGAVLEESQEWHQALQQLCSTLSLALHGAARHLPDPEWAVPALQLGREAAQKLPLLLFYPPISSGGGRNPADPPLPQQLLCVLREGGLSWHREVCEAALGLATELCTAQAAVQQGKDVLQAGDAWEGSVQGGDRGNPLLQGMVGGQAVLALLMGASGSMPPYMVQPIAEALHAVWSSAGSCRFGGWVHLAVVHLAPPEAPWRGWKPEAVHAMLVDLLSQQSAGDSRRFKRLLKVLCGGKKKGRHEPPPPRAV